MLTDMTEGIETIISLKSTRIRYFRSLQFFQWVGVEKVNNIVILNLLND